MRFLCILITISCLSMGCKVYQQDLPLTNCEGHPLSDTLTGLKTDTLKQLLKSFSEHGAPGVQLTVYDGFNWWSHSAGWAKIETRTLLKNCHLHYLQSIAKTYLATGIMQMWEAGTIDLDRPISQYLPEGITKQIKQADQITIKMLLNHTSGIKEYNFNPNYATYLFQHPNEPWDPVEYISLIDQKPLDFAPGTRYSYRNTNYVLLALIMDQITGDHAKFIQQNIIDALNLKNTYYRNDANYLNYKNLLNGYWDRYGNGIIENVSKMQQTNVASLIGDDGIVASPKDALMFLHGLLNGGLVQTETLELMKEWVSDTKGELTYGFGIDRITLVGESGMGHAGGGLGAGCELFYFPHKGYYIFLGMNLGTITSSPLHQDLLPIREEIYRVLLK